MNCTFHHLTVDLRTVEDGVPPLHIGTPHPRLGWRLMSDDIGFCQSAYRVKVFCGDDLVWDSQIITGDTQRVHCETALLPQTEYRWQVSVCDGGGAWHTSAWMPFGTGFFSLSDWPTVFVTCKGANGDLLHPEPIHLRTAFDTLPGKAVQKALLYTASTTGVYASIPGQFQTLTDKNNQYYATINGLPVTKERQNPGQVSAHHWCAYYRVYDVRDLLLTGENVLGAVTTAMAFSMCLSLTYEDGVEQLVGSDDLMMNGRGPWRLWTDGVEEHGGKSETYVSAFAYDGWDKPGYDASLWKPAIRTDVVTMLREQRTVVTSHRDLAPVSVTRQDKNRFLLDFGENIHGNLTVHIHGVPRGSWIRIRYAEMLDSHGALSPRSSMNTARAETDAQTDLYYTAEDTTDGSYEVYTSRFSMHGFRYAEISGMEQLDGQDVTAHFLYSNIDGSSGFSCSDSVLQKLYEISRCAQQCNLVSVPTDCPHRERNGWLGDAMVVAEAECLEWQLQVFYEDWFTVIRDEQFDDGFICFICPFSAIHMNGWKLDIPWCTAVAEIPWTLYMETGDDTILAENYELLCRFIAYIDVHCDADGIPVGGVMWGDHTGPVGMDARYLGALYFARMLELAGKWASVLNKSAEHSDKAQRLKEAIRTQYYHDGTFSAGLQSDLSHALYFGIVPDEDAPAIAKQLSRDLLQTRTIQAGVLGIWTILPALAQYGYNQDILRLARLTEDGSWGGWLSDGATSAYEYMHMDARGSGSYWYSLNHPFLMGSLHSWFYRTLCGITPIEPGYRRFAVNPWLGDIEAATAAVETVYGVIRVYAENGKTLTVDVPVGCHADVTWNGAAYTVGCGHHVFA